MADPRATEASPPCEAFAFAGVHGEVVADFRPPELEREVRRLIDPGAAVETVHGGRNYLYRADLETVAGRIGVVVKQFRNQGPRARLLRRWRGSKAERSFRVARAFRAAGGLVALGSDQAWIRGHAARARQHRRD